MEEVGRWRRFVGRLYYLWGTLHRHVGNLQGDREEFRLAVDAFGRALQQNPAFVQCLYERGVLLWREMGDGIAAAADMTRVLELEPERHEAWFNRAFARHVAGDEMGAVADFQRYLEVGDDPMWLEVSRQQIEDLLALGASAKEEK